jgi:hypothetical protein
VGAAVMLVTEKVEQAVTGRPNSYVPGRALLSLAGRDAPDAQQPVVAGQVMHMLSGAVLGAVRGVWSSTGLRGPAASSAHTLGRLMTDQTIENATGVGAPPQTWPRQELAVDVLHKTVYSVVTGALADRWIRPDLRSHRGAVSH